MLQTLEKLALFLAFLGSVISGYLLYIKISGATVICGLSTCGVVNSSKYSYFMGLPVSAWGLAFYISIIIFVLTKRSRLFFIAALLGVFFSAYLTYLEAFVIHAWCQWCLLSAWISFSLFIISLKLKTPAISEKTEIIAHHE